MRQRADLLGMLELSRPPKNYRWVLDMADNLLSLRIQQLEVNQLFIFKSERWDTIREMKAPSYGLLIQMLDEWPEFLEYEQTSQTAATRPAIKLALGKVAP